MRRGDQGEKVRTVQYLLGERGRGVPVDGAFGPLTEDAVRGWQAEVGLTADGIVEPETVVRIGGGVAARRSPA